MRKLRLDQQFELRLKERFVSCKIKTLHIELSKCTNVFCHLSQSEIAFTIAFICIILMITKSDIIFGFPTLVESVLYFPHLLAANAV